jgi:hypothetical protein
VNGYENDSIIIAVLTIILMLSLLLCGLWMKAKNITDKESIKFHMQLGVIAVTTGLITVGLLIIKSL